MNVNKKTVIVTTFLATIVTFGSFGNEAFANRGDRRPQGPPPEAYSACEGKNAGDEAQFTDPRGETVTGTCEQQGDRLVLRPDHPRVRPDRSEE